MGLHPNSQLPRLPLSTRRVEILGIRPQPDGPWMEQIARNVSDEGAFLAGKKYLIHDRDPSKTDVLTN
ncbi:MAG: hypothetical protein ABFE13_14655 [Phycisphaerales bacterium]